MSAFNPSFKTAFTLLFTCSAFSILLGCGRISGSVRTIGSSVPAIDFLKTEIIDNGSVPADGTSDLVVVVQLKNSNNTPVGDYQPTYEIASGAGVISSPCTKSNSNGIAACILKATQAGTKKVRLTNAKIGLTHDVTFDHPSKKGQGLELVSGSLQKGTTSDGYRAQLSAGIAFQGIQASTSDGYKGKFSVQGVMLPK